MARRENAAEPRWDDKRERWVLQVQIDGKRKAVISRKPGRAGILECKRKHVKLLQHSARDEMRLREIYPEYLEDIIKRKGADSNSWRSAEQVGRVNILPELGAYKLSMISEQDLQDLLNHAKKQDGSDYSRKTMANIRGEISLAWRYFKKRGLVDWRPDTLEIPVGLTNERKNILNLDEVRHILRDDALDPYLMAAQIMLLYGFRPGEAYGLQWADIADDRITIRRAINQRNEITEGKNRNARRTEYLIDPMKDILERARAWQRASGIISPWVLTKETGEHLRPGQGWRELRRYCEGHGLTIISPYRLRHTWASLAKSALTEAQLKLVLGHSDAMDTSVYLHAMDEDIIDTGHALQSLFQELLS